MTQRELQFPALFEPDPVTGAVVVTFPGLPGGTQADSMDEAARMASDCLATILSAYVDLGQDLPRPISRRGNLPGTRWVMPPPMAEAKLSLYAAMREAGMGSKELGQRLGWTEEQVGRLVDIRRACSLDQIETALQALGLRLTIGIETAA
ncbi:MAG: type II toxin-antitoxin system HicB family antitoxin [Acidobacteria bacterium]|nr:type II toxin-antitoxin system HicB family antitoxin [Acidobacteriota bacterium]